MAKSYKCPMCSFRGTKENLISHFEENHEECIPKGFTAGRVIFNYINNKTHGTCVVCKRPTEWNENSLKYNRLCGRKECKDKLREFYQKNMIKVHGTDNILNDVEQQKLMLSHRKISGKYKFTDGGIHTYTGTYEKNALEFLDKVLHFSSTDIFSPGPVIEYEFKGKTLKYISDIYIIPLNLMIEVKDGGANKNTRPMPSYRGKQLAKEDAIIKIGTYNYLRLTDNNFLQLVEIIMKLKMQMVDDSTDKKAIIDIHEEVDALSKSVMPVNVMNDFAEIDKYLDDTESYLQEVAAESMGLAAVGGIPGPSNIFITQYTSGENQKPKYALSSDIISDKLITMKDGKPVFEYSDKFFKDKEIKIFKYLGKESMCEVLSRFEDNETNLSIYEIVSGKEMLCDDQIECDPLFEEVNPIRINQKTAAIVQTYISSIHEINGSVMSKGLPLMKPEEILEADIKTNGKNISILESVNGFYAVDNSTGLRTINYPSIADIDLSILSEEI